MRNRIRSVAWLSAATLVLFVAGVGRSTAKADDEAPKKPQAESGIVGEWTARSVAMLLANGKQKNVSSNDGQISVAISEKAFAIRLDDKVLVDMSYVSDPQQSPCTIDMKNADGTMLGIFARKGDELRISLNDEAKGRPTDFIRGKSSLVLVLKRVVGPPIYVIDIDGAHLHPISAPARFESTGSPDWSHDGNKIAFDASRSGGSEWNVIVVNADGTEPKDLGPGTQPSWSPDDKQLVYTQVGGSVWIMNADGSERQQIDENAWGAQWAPKSNEIMFCINDKGNQNLCIYDVTKKTRRTLLDRSYHKLYWGMSWSPDGKWICFKGERSEGGEEIAAVSAEGEERGFKVILPSSASPDVENADPTVAWGGTGDQILISTKTNNDSSQRLYLFEFGSDKPPKMVPGIPASWNVGDMAWSPDGKKVVFSAHVPPGAERAR